MQKVSFTNIIYKYVHIGMSNKFLEHAFNSYNALAHILKHTYTLTPTYKHICWPTYDVGTSSHVEISFYRFRSQFRCAEEEGYNTFLKILLAIKENYTLALN